jgi:HEAT repeat protein
VLAAFQVGLRSEFATPLVQLLPVPNHRAHEDIVGALQELKDPNAVDALYEAAFVRHEYLDYDEHFGLARKCTWALADIGTPDAFAKLQSMAASENPQIADYARKRIDAWSEERDRKV